MSFWDLLFIAIGLAMDALAVAIGKGLAANGECKKICIITGLYFGSFQTFMPFLGFLCGETISHYITFAALEVNIIIAVLLIGFIAFLFSCIGAKIGSIFGSRFEKQSGILGGIILILIGIKIFVVGH